MTDIDAGADAIADAGTSTAADDIGTEIAPPESPGQLHQALLMPEPGGAASRAVHEILPIPMPDGTILRADVVRPDDDAAHLDGPDMRLGAPDSRLPTGWHKLTINITDIMSDKEYE